MTPAEKQKEMFDVLGAAIALTRELDTLTERPIRDEETRRRVHEVMASLSGHLLVVDDYEEYTGGGVIETMHSVNERALVMLGESSEANDAETMFGLAA